MVLPDNRGFILKLNYSGGRPGWDLGGEPENNKKRYLGSGSDYGRPETRPSSADGGF
eukprot:SAG31_NODE_20457_length_573_cov_24.919831_1_plen_56_part_01